MHILEFKTEYRGARPPVDWVLIGGDGESLERTKTWQRIKDLKPAETEGDPEVGSAAFEARFRWDKIEPAYQAWKKGEDIPTHGTPLAAWSGLNAEQAGHLKRLGIKTVEELRDATDSIFSALPFPNSRQLKELAARFLDSRSDSARDEEAVQMKERIAALEAALATATSGDEAVAQNEPRRPGRPRKEAA